MCMEIYKNIFSSFPLVINPKTYNISALHSAQNISGGDENDDNN